MIRSLETIGDVRKGSCDKGRVSFEWRIPNICSLTENFHVVYRSPNFECLYSSFHLRISPQFFESKKLIRIDLYRHSKINFPRCIFFTLAVKKADNTEEEILSNQRCPETFSPWTQKFLLTSELLRRKSELLPSGGLTMIYTVWNDEPPSSEGKRLVTRETQTEDLTSTAYAKGGTILRKHFKALLLDGQNHDVILKVKDKDFKAHQNILAARSPVFAAMFTHSMKETESRSVSIEDCDPESFCEFLQYVYTGRVENLLPGNAMGLFYIADKYDFLELKETCVEYLKSSLSKCVIGDVISFAVKHGEDDLLDSAVTFFSKHLEEILITVEWQRFFMSNPMQANELYIKALKTSYKKID